MTSSPGYANLFGRLWRHFRPRRKKQFFLLMILMTISAFAEVISLGAVLPFLGVLTAPDVILQKPWMHDFAEAWGITSPDQLLLPMTVAFAVTALIAGGIRILLLWVNTRLAFASGADLSIEVYKRTLYQPYKIHVSRNSSVIISGMIEKVSNSVSVLYQVLTLMSSIVLLVAITAALLAINPVIAMQALIGFGFCYGLISWKTRRQLRQNSRMISQKQTEVIKALQEGLGGIRDVLLDGTQPIYCELYKRADQPLRWARGNNLFIGGSPRFAMESLGMVMIAILAYNLTKSGGISGVLPTLGALALGAQRLLPALQQGYSAWVSIAGNYTSLVDTIELLEQPMPEEMLLPAPPALQFQKDIHFEKMRFRYSSEGPWVIDNLDLTIPKGSRVGFVGTTGSGKSTALDLLMGLLTPTEGDLLVDGQSIHSAQEKNLRRRAWQRAIAHVPQNIYLTDATLAENIAFGVPKESIDHARVREAARKAHIAEFIENRPGGYESFVGERGIRLSGGQRQRIGIARALYKQASVLVFDEATSALDSATEESVMEAIEALDPDLTILMIAHRLTTVQRCDRIIEMSDGRIVGQGTYQDLLQNSASFRKMAQMNRGSSAGSLASSGRG